MKTLTKIMIILISFTSCRTAMKEKSAVLQEKVSVQTEAVKTGHEKDFVTRQNLESLIADLKIIDNTYSAPDTSGLQHIIRQKIYKLDLKSGKEEIQDEKSEKQTDIVVHQDEQQQNQEVFAEKKETEFNTFKPPRGVVFILILIIIFNIILYRKRQK